MKKRLSVWLSRARDSDSKQVPLSKELIDLAKDIQTTRENSLGRNDPKNEVITVISRIRLTAQTLTANGIDIVPHTWGSSIGLHVALHFISNLESIPGRMNKSDFYLEYDQTENALRENLTLPKVEMIDGKILVPKSPGLGLEVNEDALNIYTKKTIEVKNLKKLIKQN